MSEMRIWCTAALVALGVAGCKGSGETAEEDRPVADYGAAGSAEVLSRTETGKLLLRTSRNARLWRRLMTEGKTQQAVALAQSIGATVDENFETFARVARTGEYELRRNDAVMALGFARQRRIEARDTLLSLLNDPSPTIVANSAYGLSIIRDPDTDLTRLIELVGSGDIGIRVNAATALKEIYRFRKPNRDLTPDDRAAIDRLANLLHDRATTRGRRAAAWAFANMKHEEVLEHLIAALEDDDLQVQIGGLAGIKKLGDQRALEPVLEYLDETANPQGASWAREALIAIALQSGFAETAEELEPNGVNARKWRRWFKAARTR